MNKAKTARSLLFLAALSSTLLLQGCAPGGSSDGKIHITMLQYKPEAVKAFEKIEENSMQPTMISTLTSNLPTRQ